MELLNKNLIEQTDDKVANDTIDRVSTPHGSSINTRANDNYHMRPARWQHSDANIFGFGDEVISRMDSHLALNSARISAMIDPNRQQTVRVGSQADVLIELERDASLKLRNLNGEEYIVSFDESGDIFISDNN